MDKQMLISYALVLFGFIVKIALEVQKNKEENLIAIIEYFKKNQVSVLISLAGCFVAVSMWKDGLLEMGTVPQNIIPFIIGIFGETFLKNVVPVIGKAMKKK